MDINESLSLVNSVAQGIKDLRGAYDAIPLRTFLPPTKNKLANLENQITSIQEKVNDLEENFNKGFPELARLIRSYSRLISDVRIAGALSDKAAEIYGLAPDLAPRFTTMFANDRQNDYSRISSSISQLPSLDVSQKGRLEAKLSMIRDLVRDMKNINQDDIRNIKRILDDISTQYSDVESILSELAERILNSLEPS